MGNLSFEHGGNIYEMEKKYKRRFLDFSANISPVGLPSKLKKILYRSFKRSIPNYPDINTQDITGKIARYWGLKEENILVGNGSVELIYVILNTFKPDKVSIVSPSFSEYERAARDIGSKITFISLNMKKNLHLPKGALKRADAIIFANPNNPTGNLILEAKDKIRELSAKLIIADEAFMDFLPDEKNHTLIKMAQMDNRIIVLRTFTKFFSLAGLRIGYLVAHKDVVKEIKAHKVPWSVNSLAQLAAGQILDDKKYIHNVRRLIERERSFLFNKISAIKKLIPYPSVANFLLIKIDDGRLTSSLLKKRLLKKGVLIRDCVNFKGLNNKFLRVAVRNRNENIRLVSALKSALQ